MLSVCGHASSAGGIRTGNASKDFQSIRQKKRNGAVRFDSRSERSELANNDSEIDERRNNAYQRSVQHKSRYRFSRDPHPEWKGHYKNDWRNEGQDRLHFYKWRYAKRDRD